LTNAEWIEDEMSRRERVDLAMQMLRPLATPVRGIAILFLLGIVLVKKLDLQDDPASMSILAGSLAGCGALAWSADRKLTRTFQGQKLDRLVPRWPVRVRYEIDEHSLTAHGELGDRTTLNHEQMCSARAVGDFLVLQYAGLITIQLRRDRLTPSFLALLQGGAPPTLNWPDVGV